MEGAALERVSHGELAYYRHAAWRELRHGIFTRRGGVSQAPYASLNMGASIGDELDAVKENQRRMYAAVDVNPLRAMSCWLVHSVTTLVINGQPAGNGQLQQADAMITNQSDLPLVMRYADCVPLLMVDPVKRAIGLGHAGWRGTVLGMAGKMVDSMVAAFGSSPGDIQALIGPAISARHYAVGDEVVAAANAYFGADAGLIQPHPGSGAATFDLWRANQLDLQRHGLKQVEIMASCTYENKDDFFSHRAENGKTGRFGVVISL